MPVQYKINKTRNLVETKAFGLFSDEDLQKLHRSLIDDPNFSPSLCFLGDFTEVEEIGITARCIHECAEGNPFGEGSRRALVVSKEIAYGYARMYQILTDPMPDEVRIFKDLDKAIYWLSGAIVDSKVA